VESQRPPRPPEKAERTGRIPRSIRWLGVASYLTDVQSEILMPLLPFFLLDTLGADARALGLVEGAADAAAALLAVASGRLSDRVRWRKPLVVAGYSLSAVVKPLIGLAASTPLVLLLRVSDRAGKGIRGAPRDGMIADAAPSGERGRLFGFHRMMDNAGAVTGSLVAALLLTLHVADYRTIFLATLPLGVLPVLVLLARVHESPRVEPPPLDLPDGGSSPPLGAAFLAFLAVTGLFALGAFSYAFVLRRASTLGLSPAHVTWLYLLYNVVQTAFPMALGGLSDRIGRRGVLAIAFGSYAVTTIGFALAASPWIAWPLVAVYGFHHAALHPVARAFAADLAPAERRATALGLYQGVTGALALPAGLLAGTMWTRVGPYAPFALAAVLATLAAVLLFLLPRSDTRRG
jgi:MFS family permease